MNRSSHNLQLLARRAAVVFSDLSQRVSDLPPNGELPPLVVERSSSLCCSLLQLLELAHDRHGNASLSQALSATSQCLSTAVAALPAHAEVPPKSLKHLFYFLHKSRHHCDPAARAGLLQAMDGRTGVATFQLWTPRHLLGALHSVASCSPAQSEAQMPIWQPPDFVEDLVMPLQQQLTSLSASDTAQLLWCLATLRLCSRYAILWCATCTRCTQLYAGMNAVARSAVAQALLVSGQMGPREQVELAALVSRASDAGSSSGGGGGDARWNRPSDAGTQQSSQPLVDNAARSQRERQQRRLEAQITANAHTLPTDSLLFLAEQAVAGANNSTEGVSASGLPEDTIFLLDVLSHRRLASGEAVRIVQALQRVPHLWDSGAGNPASALLERFLRTALRETGGAGVSESTPESLKKIAALLPVFAASLEAELSRRSTAAAAITGDDAWTAFTQLQRGTVAAVLEHAAQGSMDGVDGAAAFSLLASSDVLTAASKTRACVADALQSASTPAAENADDEVETLLYRTLSHGPEAHSFQWSVITTTAGCSEAVGAVCFGLLSRHSSRVLRLVSQAQSLLLERCAALDTRAVFSLLSILQNHPPALEAALSPLAAALVAVLESRGPKVTLPDLLFFISSETQNAGSQLHTSRGSVTHNAVLELFIRRLALEGQNVNGRHLELLCSLLEQRRQSPALLQKALSLLITPNQQSGKSFIESTPLPCPVLVRLVDLSASCIPDTKFRQSVLSLLCARLPDALAGCANIQQVSAAASLLRHRAFADDSTQKATLVNSVCSTAISLLRSGPKPASALDRAYLVAHLVNAKVDIPDDLNTALRL